MPRADQRNPASSSEHVQRMLQEWYYKSDGPAPGGAGEWKPQPQHIVRVQLDADWYDGSAAHGHVLVIRDDDAHGEPRPEWIVNLRNPLGLKFDGTHAADGVNAFMLAGTCFWAIETSDGPSPPTDTESERQGPWYEPLTPWPWQFGKLDYALAYNASTPVACSVWKLGSSGWEDSGQNVNVWPPFILTSGTIAAGKRVKIEWHGQAQQWYVTGTEC